jgi:hypothetical protein
MIELLKKFCNKHIIIYVNNTKLFDYNTEFVLHNDITNCLHDIIFSVKCDPSTPRDKSLNIYLTCIVGSN